MSNNTIDTIVMSCAALRPYPPADIGVGGDAVVGTLGTPAVTNRNKVVTLLEEGIDLYGTKRERRSAVPIRGDAVDDALVDVTNYSVVACLTGTTGADDARIAGNGNIFPGSIQVLDQLAAGGVVVSGVLGNACWNLDGYGSIDVGLAAETSVADISQGKYGITSANFKPFNYRAPVVTCFAPSWRNLLANVRWNYQTGGLGDSSTTLWPPKWDRSVGNAGLATIASGSNSITRLTSGNGSYYFVPGAATVVREQYVPLGHTSQVWNDPNRKSNWNPRGLTIIACGFFRNINADTNDTAQIDLTCYDINAATLGSAGTGAFAPASTTWQYRETVLLSAPANTAAAGVKLTFAEVAGGGTANADTSATEMRLFVGQFAGNTSTLLGNYSFDNGTTSSWTVDAGAFVVATTNASPSSNYVQGGANATNTIHQDYALPAGFEYGTAILRCWRMQTLSGDAGEVKVQVLDSLNNVLATATTGSETLAQLNIWYSRTLWVDTVDGAAKIRVSFTALRSLGTGNSGACLDEAALMFAKNLD